MREYHACINLISGIEKDQESWINRVSVLFTELYLTMLCEEQKKDDQNFKFKEVIKYEKEQKKDQVLLNNSNQEDFDLKSQDSEHFIQINQLQNNFNDAVEQLTTLCHSFWEKFQQADFTVTKVYDNGMKIADMIYKTYSLFHKLEHESLTKDHKLYLTFALIQKHVLHDMDLYA